MGCNNGLEEPDLMPHTALLPQWALLCCPVLLRPILAHCCYGVSVLFSSFFANSSMHHSFLWWNGQYPVLLLLPTVSSLNEVHRWLRPKSRITASNHNVAHNQNNHLQAACLLTATACVVPASWSSSSLLMPSLSPTTQLSTLHVS